MSTIKKIAVLGGGSFGTVMANIAASNGYDVSLWVRDSDQALRINSEGANVIYHPELQLSSNIEASENLESVIKNANIVLIATPSLIFENIVKRISPMVEGELILFLAQKELNQILLDQCQILLK